MLGSVGLGMSGVTAGVVQYSTDADGAGADAINEQERRIRRGHFTCTGRPAFSAHARVALKRFRLLLDSLDYAVRCPLDRNEQPSLKFVFVCLGRPFKPFRRPETATTWSSRLASLLGIFTLSVILGFLIT